MYKLKVKNIKKETLVEDGSRYLDVECQILKDGKVTEIRKLSFPLKTSKEKLEKDLKKYIDLYNKEAEERIKSAKKNKMEKEADRIIKKVKGLEL